MSPRRSPRYVPSSLALLSAWTSLEGVGVGCGQRGMVEGTAQWGPLQGGQTLWLEVAEGGIAELG